MVGRLLRSKKVWVVVAILLGGIAVLAWRHTMGDPVVRRTIITTADLPAGSPPVRIALISDIHVAGPDMPPERLERIVTQINALRPDVVMIAGDFVSDKRTATHIYRPDEIIAPLAGLETRLGVVAAPGNHDHWYNLPGLAAELRRAGITLLSNEAEQVGPLAVGGLDDAYTGRDDVPATLSAMRGLSGPRIILSHSPDPFPALPPDFGLMLAGHTHCGQIAYPWGGAPAHLSDYGDRYGCGRVDERGNTVITGAGLGTSLIWIRLFARPEIWILELRAKGA